MRGRRIEFAGRRILLGKGEEMRRFIPWIFLIAVLAAGSLAVWRWVGASNLISTALARSERAAAVANTPVTRPIDAKNLFDPNLDPPSRSALSEKLDMENKLDDDRTAGAANPAPKTSNQGIGAPNSADALEQVASGIFPGSDAMVKPEEARINNYWQGVVNGQVMVVLAGSAPDDESKGLVVILTSDGFSLTGYKQVAAPEGSASLTILEAAADQLILEDTQGKQLMFSLTAQAFE
jgi:hypothetical protein